MKKDLLKEIEDDCRASISLTTAAACLGISRKKFRSILLNEYNELKMHRLEDPSVELKLKNHGFAIEVFESPNGKIDFRIPRQPFVIYMKYGKYYSNHQKCCQ
ncbi:MAG: hypothetical protein LIO69_09405 [Oscillospiraceae bacterium]|nr:hypothetical protein [Oscillospiraceae bacterium]